MAALIPKKGKKKGNLCPFCSRGVEPDYKNYKDLLEFISDRARILAKAKTGVCSKHQRKLAQEIKRARHLGLLPFVPRV